MKFNFCLVLAVCSMAFGAASASASVVLSNASGVADVGVSIPYSDSGPSAQNSNGSPTALAQVSSAAGYAGASVGAGVPSVYATSYVDFTAQNAGAQAMETYEFSINGPANISVPVTISGATYATSTDQVTNLGVTIAKSSVQIEGIQGNQGFQTTLGESCAAGAECGGLGSPGVTRFTSNMSLMSDTSYGIIMSALASSQAGVTPGGIYQATAGADPFIQIAPDFLSDNPGFTLAFSTGIVNAPSAVPLPASLPMFIACLLGLMGVSRIRNQRKPGLTC